MLYLAIVLRLLFVSVNASGEGTNFLVVKVKDRFYGLNLLLILPYKLYKEYKRSFPEKENNATFDKGVHTFFEKNADKLLEDKHVLIALTVKG